MLSTTALVLKTLTSYAPKHFVDLADVAHLANLDLADSNPTSSEPISVIVGADIYNDIILDGLRKGDHSQPIAQKTIFGWVVSGPLAGTPSALSESSSTALNAVQVSALHSLANPSLEALLQNFWSVEEPPHRPIVSPDDEQCEKHFRATHSRSEDGRYVVRLPFKQGPPIEIGESRRRTEKLLASLMRRLSAHTDQLSEYREFLAEYEQLGHMRQVPADAKPNGQRVYIPHHAVLRDGSATTHLRVVFNASCLTDNGSSLNDHLLAGPKLQTDLPSVILKYRTYRYVYAADVAKMYRQIWLDTRDLDYQRILWQPDPPNSLIEYQLRTITYGMKCAPFLALRVIQQLVADEGERYPLAVPILRDNIYVDDVLFGGNDIAGVRQARDQLVALLSRGGFALRKWASNASSLLEDLDADNHGLACKSFSPDESVKLLGIAWNPSLDDFQITVSLLTMAPSSKRTILSAIAQLYDPLGWVTPVTIAAKIFMQHL